MYKITERLWYGMESERYSDLTLFENSDEVFAISCTIFDKYDMDAYRCHGVTAFKMRGNWPQVLLENYAKMQIERQKLTDGIKFYRAEEIKSKFQT